MRQVPPCGIFLCSQVHTMFLPSAMIHHTCLLLFNRGPFLWCIQMLRHSDINSSTQQQLVELLDQLVRASNCSFACPKVCLRFMNSLFDVNFRRLLNCLLLCNQSPLLNRYFSGLFACNSNLGVFFSPSNKSSIGCLSRKWISIHFQCAY
jgi:hypothetical protein